MSNNKWYTAESEWQQPANEKSASIKWMIFHQSQYQTIMIDTAINVGYIRCSAACLCVRHAGKHHDAVCERDMHGRDQGTRN